MQICLSILETKHKEIGSVFVLSCIFLGEGKRCVCVRVCLCASVVNIFLSFVFVFCSAVGA